MKTITKDQIQAVGDSALTWIETQLGQGWLAKTLIDPLLEGLRSKWDASGAADVAKLLTDMGWTVE